MKLRDYQVSAVNAIRLSFAEGRTSPCVVLPTGAGKTAVGCAYLEQWEPQSRICWLVPRLALIDQTWRAARKIGDFFGRMTVTTVQSLLSDRKSIPDVDVCVVDEAHFFYGTKEWASIAKSFPRRIAFTATPTRADGSPLKELCDELVVGPQRRQLMDQGFLPKVRTFAPDKRRSMEAWGPLDLYTMRANGEKAIVFCQTMAHAKEVRDRFVAGGVRAGVCTSDAVGKNDDLNLHAAGFLDVLANVYMVSVGYDDPTVTTAIMARPFGTATGYIQAAGRARGLDASEIKILDLYGACHEWGLLDEDREYSLGDDQPIRVKKEFPLAVCPGCQALYRTSPFVTTCPDCQAPRERFVTPKERRRTEVVERRRVEPDDAKFAYLLKQVAIMKNKPLPRWVPVHQYKKRYGERPPTEWLVKVGLRRPE